MALSPFDHPLVSARYFFPLQTPPPQPPWWVTAAEGARLACWQAPPADDGARVLLHFHGNGEVVADYLPAWPRQVAALGLRAAHAEYRGYGASSGAPCLVGMLDDAVRIFEALALPPERVIAFGRSVGSIYAVHLAAQVPTLAGLVLESGIAWPLQRVLLRASPAELGTTPEALRAEAALHLDHGAKLARYAGPALILHARGDDLVPVAHAEQLAAWLGARATLRILPHGDHNSIFYANQAEYLRALGAFAAQLGP